MSKDEYKKLVSIEIKKFINKRIEIRRIYKELQQIKNNILYLKEKYGQEITEGFQTENGKLSISKYKSEFSSRLKKEFKDLSIEEKRKLYKSGLLTILGLFLLTIILFSITLVRLPTITLLEPLLPEWYATLLPFLYPLFQLSPLFQPFPYHPL